MRLHTHEIVDLNTLVPNPRGLAILSITISLCLLMDTSVVVLLYFQNMLFDPYMGSALAVNLATLVAVGVSLGQRNLFYAPLLMSVVTSVGMIFYLLVFYRYSSDLIFLLAVANVSLMLVLWTAYATTIKSAPAPWLHPYQRPAELKADLAMTDMASL